VSAFFFAMFEISLLQILVLELGKSLPRLPDAAEHIAHGHLRVD
jgi:hypothetical protein